jgi:hypothetical protein
MKFINETLLQAAAMPLIGPKGENLLTVIVKGTFVFDSNQCEPADDQLPIAYGDIYHDEAAGGAIRYESDIVPFKPRTDIVLEASAYAPGGKPAEIVPAAVKVGPVEKRIVVFGERFWNHAGILSRTYTMTAVKPFTRKPIRYSDAFGGMDEATGEYCPQNLAGKGLYSKKSRRLAGRPLPCIENPKHLIRRITDRPLPVGFGFYHRAWHPRAAYAGTYDDTWRKQRCPLPPEDFDARFYNGAHPDLQADGYLKGDETVQLLNLTPEGRTAFGLPGLRPFVLVAPRAGKNGNVKKESCAMNLDTVFIEADRRRCCLVWRAGLVSDPAAPVETLEIDLRPE